MKKRMMWVSLLLVCVIMLSSCGTVLNVMPAAMTAGQVERRMNLRLNSLQSYRVDVEAEFTVYADTTKITGQANGYMIEDQGKDKNDYYYYSEMTNKMNASKDALNVTIKSITAYHDGYAFDHYKQGDTWRKLCSEMTPKEYRKYISDDSLNGLTLEQCENREMEKVDGGYVLHFSGYSQDTMEQLSELMGMTEDLFKRKPIDMKVDMEIDEDYYPGKISLEMVFEEKTSYYQPAYSMTMTYSQFDQVERKTSNLSPDSYKKIESLALLKEIDEMIEDRINAKEGSFTATTSVSASLLDQTNKQTETAKVTYARDKDKLTFEADVTEGKDSKHISYADGNQTTTYEGEDSNTIKKTEQEAEDYIAELINVPGLGYTSLFVTDIEKTDDGYRIQMDVSKDSTVGQLVVASGATFTSGAHTITIKVKDGSITSITSEFRATGSIQISFNGKASLNYNGTIKVEFD